MNTRIDEKKSFDLEKALELIETLVLEKPDLFTAHNKKTKPAMFEAAESQTPVLFRVLSLLIPSSTVERLKNDRNACEKGSTTCPLLDVAKGRLDQCSKSADNGTADSPNNAEPFDQTDLKNAPEAMPVVDRSSMNANIQCLHNDIDVGRVLEENDKLRDTLVKLLSDPRAFSGCLQPLLLASNFENSLTGNGNQTIPLDGFRALLQLCPDNFFTEPPSSGYTPLQNAIRHYNNEKSDYNLLFSAIKELIARCPASIFLETTIGKERVTAYRLLKGCDNGKSVTNMMWRFETERLIKEVCIGSRDKTWEEKKNFLYWDAKSQHHFQLNLVGESALLGNDYIAAMKDKSGMRFEPILDFVKLPYWKPEYAKSSKHTTTDSQNAQAVTTNNEPIKADPYEAIFEWLRQCKIKKIFTVEVDDDGPEPHTNGAIRKSLKDIQVEVWKWRKFDICTETVAAAAPNAREVHLYSHGNTAVLRGWAHSPGFSKLKHLQKLVVEIYPQNSSDDADCENYKKDFKKCIRAQCPWLADDAILFEKHCPQNGQGGTTRQRSREINSKVKNLDTETDEMQKPTEWLRRLSNFIQFMSELDPQCKPEDTEASDVDIKGNGLSVKVALLDDGCKLETLEGKQEGQSFHHDQEEFFVGPCSHGTEMARCIREVCPKAELYIARLDNSHKYENQKFTIASCCKALRWAIDMEVDVISMSWSFKRMGSADRDEKEFTELIGEAAKKNILLFASLPDIALAETGQFVPVSLEGVIKIGSATVFGESSKENKYAKPDFLLPGEGIALSTGEKAKGSSFSTAYASGLAASMLYCLRAHKMLIQSNEDEYCALQIAKMTKGMKDIFRRLGQSLDSTPGATVFVQPYHYLPREFKVSQGGMKEDLEAIVNLIVPGTVLWNFIQ